MAFSHLENIPLDIAKKEYLEVLLLNGMSPQTEMIPVAKAAGRVTAAPVYARICAPHYNACAMDGIALDAKVTFGAGENTPVLLTAGQYKQVNTGNPLPDGCDAVVMIEDVIEVSGGVKLYGAAAPWQHVRQIGEDVCAGEMLLTSYTRISSSAVGAMIAGGITEVEVIKRPVVGIIPTGDELVLPTADPQAGDILEFNSAIFSSMLQEWGTEVVVYPIVKDDPDLIRAAIRTTVVQCDIVILNAGSSAGSEDFAADAISDVGYILYHGLAIKPGKPAILGYCGAKPVLGVPGYPVAGIIVIEELLHPIIDFLCGRICSGYEYVDAVLSKAVVSTLKYREFVRVRVGCINKKLIATPLSRGSGVVTSFMKADGIVEVPQDVEGYDSGAGVRVRLLRPIRELENSIVVTGSHDPLFDELSELLRAGKIDLSVSSSHVGSMGGIMAVRRGEAHIAGIHMLDETSGEYNIPFVKRHLPKGGVRLIGCVKRLQGLILQQGNPKNITGIADLVQEGLRYINRQKGSGTRILIEYLCRKQGIDTSMIYGFNREEYTHTSVAALIASGSADAGLGIYSAAKMYGLEFVPICDEQYDLLIPDFAWELPMVQKLLEIIRSDAFRQRLDVLGGYTVENPGAVRLHLSHQ